MLTVSLSLNCTPPNLHIALSLNPQFPIASQLKYTRGRKDCEGHILLQRSEPTEGGGSEGRGNNGGQRLGQAMKGEPGV
jgi:hypothetical protein